MILSWHANGSKAISDGAAEIYSDPLSFYPPTMHSRWNREQTIGVDAETGTELMTTQAALIPSNQSSLLWAAVEVMTDSLGSHKPLHLLGTNGQVTRIYFVLLSLPLIGYRE